jgi:hypothetical protein
MNYAVLMVEVTKACSSAAGWPRSGSAGTELVRGFGEDTVVGRKPGGHHKASDGASSEARQREHGLITAPVADPSVWFVRELSVWFVRELLHCCQGRR